MDLQTDGDQRTAAPPSATVEPVAAEPSRATGAAYLSGLRTVKIELDALQALLDLLGGALRAPFDAAVAELLGTSGRVVVTGIGKSGHIARKLASTLASTGTPAGFIHPTEASHGDLGMITSQDVVVALSWSGETTELGDIISFSRRFAVRLIAITCNASSTLARAADIALVLPNVIEACPHNLAPTSSSAMQLALGDALAIALLEERGFSALEFKDFHPGGKLSARLKTVGQLMHTGAEVPLVRRGLSMSEVLLAIVGKRFGCAGVVDDDGRLVGIVTDGDLRRHMGRSILQQPVDEIMTSDPVTLKPSVFASSALELMNRRAITALFIVEDGRPTGILHIHDVLRAGVV